MAAWLLAVALGATTPTQVEFPSEDGLVLTGDLYAPHPKTAPLIVLFHQAGWSRGEYREIAPKLVAMGFNCLAVDQRSGGAVEGVTNESHARAVGAKKRTTYLDALPDVRAALRYARTEHARGSVIAWGSSYSAALVLRVAGEAPELADATLAFSPGEYFRKAGKGPRWIREAAAKIDEPVFITSSRSEAGQWKAIFEAIPAAGKSSFIPKGAGKHGSRALWSASADASEYWQAVETFLRHHAGLTQPSQH